MRWLARLLYQWIAVKRLAGNNPDVIIGGTADPYMHRWWVIPRNRIFNVYLHRFYRSDDDRALHDHPWFNLSILLQGEYTEHRIKAGGIHTRNVLRAGSMRLRGPKTAHRIELTDGQCISLFVTGPRMRTWGFHCPQRGWVPWWAFLHDYGDTSGPGCDAP